MLPQGFKIPTIKLMPFDEYQEYFKHELPRRYIINDGATILFWSDGTKTIVKKSEDDEEDIVKSFLWAYFQKQSGLSKTQANKYLKKISEQCRTEVNSAEETIFKVGDKVKIKSGYCGSNFQKDEIVTILEIDEEDTELYAKCVNSDGYTWWFGKNDIEKVQQ